MMPIVVGDFQPTKLPKKLLGRLFLASQVTQVQGDDDSTVVTQHEEKCEEGFVCLFGFVSGVLAIVLIRFVADYMFGGRYAVQNACIAGSTHEHVAQQSTERFSAKSTWSLAGPRHRRCCLLVRVLQRKLHGGMSTNIFFPNTRELSHAGCGCWYLDTSFTKIMDRQHVVHPFESFVFLHSLSCHQHNGLRHL